MISPNLRLRVLSSLIILPAVGFLLFVGGWAFVGFAVLISGLMAWEWGQLVTSGHPTSISFALAILAASIVGVSPTLGASLTAVVVAVGLLAMLVAGRVMGIAFPRLCAIGLAVSTLPLISLVWLRDLPDIGFTIVLWAIAAVVAVDTGAYLAGKSIGGPKLAPQLSPNKTWAGLIGGMLASAVVTIAFRYYLLPEAGGPTGGLVNVATMAVIGAGVAVVAQAGDLAESAVKRYFGAKDSGQIIPGHGGILDRVDGHIAVMPVLALIGWARGGVIF